MDLRFLTINFISALALTGCGVKWGMPTVELTKSSRALLVAASDYQTGSLVRLDIERHTANLKYAPIHSDAIVVSFPQVPDIFVINRLGADNIQRIDPTTGTTLAQWSVGIGANPQDMWVYGDYAYVSFLQKSYLLKMNLKTGETITKIDLSSYADSDGFPESARMADVDGRLWIQLQRLNQEKNYAPANSSQIVVVDPDQDRVIQTIDLRASNPTTPFKMTGDEYVLVGESGYVGSESRLDGGIEKIDTRNYQSLGFITTELQLGGDIVDFECWSQEKCVAIISKPATELVSFNPRNGALEKRIIVSSGFYLKQVIYDKHDDLLYLADGNPRGPSVRVFSSSLQEQWDLGWKLELPPYQMKLLDY
ncbi:MAG: hypothetical protein EB078_04775 [Proteobacteria bacterium]|nr:hypothetical protein [Pseudomonadota bacterium]NDC24854.1 hypothetical protein [Pseudomonadota bacterium]NDD04197.1 hypothetical protein [Pseudomonadota bacterium]NDG26846.1 hypothetical protein [Pseudomonadota bacterium]